MSARILVAGIGNVFLGDDGFGVEVARRLTERQLPDGVKVVDFGIRALDLVYALMDGPEAVVFVDAAPRGGPPGTLYLIEAERDDDGCVAMDTHGMDPVTVLAMVRAMGAPAVRTYVVGCEPESVMDGATTEEIVGELSPAVRASVDEAVGMVESLVDRILSDRQPLAA